MTTELHNANVNIDTAGNGNFGRNLRVGGGLKLTVTANAATSYSVVETDAVISCTNTSARTVTLPDAGQPTSAGRIIGVKDTALTAATATLTVKATAGTIDGTAAATGVTITNTGGALVFIGDGTNWNILAKY